MAAPHTAIVLRRESVLSNLRAFSTLRELDDSRSLSFRERAEDSISIALRSALRDDDFDTFFDVLDAILHEKYSINEFAETIAARIIELQTRRPKNWKPLQARIHRLSGRLKAIGEKTLSVKNKSLIQISLSTLLSRTGGV